MNESKSHNPKDLQLSLTGNLGSDILSNHIIGPIASNEKLLEKY